MKTKNDTFLRTALNSFPSRVLDLADAYEVVSLKVEQLQRIDATLGAEAREIENEVRRISNLNKPEWFLLTEVLSNITDDLYEKLGDNQDRLDDAECDLDDLINTIETFHLNLNDCNIR